MLHRRQYEGEEEKLAAQKHNALFKWAVRDINACDDARVGELVLAHNLLRDVPRPIRYRGTGWLGGQIGLVMVYVPTVGLGVVMAAFEVKVELRIGEGFNTIFVLFP